MKTSAMRDRAQTNLQLYEQLLSAGYSRDQVERVRLAYMLAVKLFAAQVRPEGRPFVCHLVGVASLLAMLEAQPPTIIAGLVHSAYTHGDFGFGMGEAHGRSRDELRHAVGPEVEQLVTDYANQHWSASSVAKWATNPASIGPAARQVILIRLANSLEDALDRGLQLSAKGDHRDRGIPVDDVVNLAGALGYPQLATALRSALQTDEDQRDLEGPREHHRGTYLVCPASWREKILPRLVRFALRLRARI